MKKSIVKIDIVNKFILRKLEERNGEATTVMKDVSNFLCETYCFDRKTADEVSQYLVDNFLAKIIDLEIDFKAS